MAATGRRWQVPWRRTHGNEAAAEWKGRAPAALVADQSNCLNAATIMPSTECFAVGRFKMPLLEAPPAIELPHVAAEFEATESGARFSVVRPRCAAVKAGEIVVCATDPRRNRLQALPDSPPEGLPKAAARLSENATIDLHTEYAQISGVPSNRAMVGVKIGF